MVGVVHQGSRSTRERDLNIFCSFRSQHHFDHFRIYPRSAVSYYDIFFWPVSYHKKTKKGSYDKNNLPFELITNPKMDEITKIILSNWVNIYLFMMNHTKFDQNIKFFNKFLLSKFIQYLAKILRVPLW